MIAPVLLRSWPIVGEPTTKDLGKPLANAPMVTRKGERHPWACGSMCMASGAEHMAAPTKYCTSRKLLPSRLPTRSHTDLCRRLIRTDLAAWSPERTCGKQLPVRRALPASPSARRRGQVLTSPRHQDPRDGPQLSYLASPVSLSASRGKRATRKLERPGDHVCIN